MDNHLSKIYIHHYTKLTARKNYLLQAFSDCPVPIKWMEEYDRESIDPSLIDRWFVFTPEEHNKRKQLMKHSQFDLRWMPKCCSNNAKALGVSNIMMFKDIVQNNKQGNFLSLEDDVLFPTNWLSVWNQVYIQLPPDWDILFLGNGEKNSELFNTNYTLTTHFKWRQMPYGLFSDSYLVTYKTAVKMWDNWQTGFHLPNDWEINYQINALQLKTYWLTPGLFFQGSMLKSRENKSSTTKDQIHSDYESTCENDVL